VLDLYESGASASRLITCICTVVVRLEILTISAEIYIQLPTTLVRVICIARSDVH